MFKSEDVMMLYDTFIQKKCFCMKTEGEGV